MDSSIPKFENPESLEQYLENLKLQLLTSEFAALGKISQDSGPHKEKVLYLLENQIYFLKDPSKIDGKLQARVENLEFFIRKQNGLNDDINPCPWQSVTFVVIYKKLSPDKKKERPVED